MRRETKFWSTKYIIVFRHDFYDCVNSNPLSMDDVREPSSGKMFRLINVPFYYVCMLDKVIARVLKT